MAKLIFGAFLAILVAGTVVAAQQTPAAKKGTTVFVPCGCPY